MEVSDSNLFDSKDSSNSNINITKHVQSTGFKFGFGPQIIIDPQFQSLSSNNNSKNLDQSQTFHKSRKTEHSLPNNKLLGSGLVSQDLDENMKYLPPLRQSLMNNKINIKRKSAF